MVATARPSVAGLWRRRRKISAESYLPSFLRWTRVRRSSLRCFFFDMRLRRFLITEPIENLRLRYLTCERLLTDAEITALLYPAHWR